MSQPQLSPRQLDTILAALQLWQVRNIPHMDSERAGAIESLAREHGPALDVEEIESLSAQLSATAPVHGLCTYLDASTEHLTAIDAELLRAHACICDEHGPSGGPYGWWVHVSEDAAERRRRLTKAGFAETFLVLLDHAQKLGCNWILFDRDADTIAGFTAFSDIDEGKASP